MSATQFPSKFVIQNFDNSYWGESSPVTDLKDAKKFGSREAADRRLGANRLAMLGATKAEILEVVPTVTYALVPVETSPADTAAQV